MSRLDGPSEVSIASTLLPAVYDSTEDGAAVDLANYDAATIIIAAGTLAADSGTPAVPFEVQHAPDNAGSPGSWAAVPDTQLIGTEPTIAAANDETVHVLGYTGTYRWLRVSIVDTITGTGTELPASAAIVRQKRRYSGQ